MMTTKQAAEIKIVQKFNNSCVKTQTSELKKQQDADRAVIIKLTENIKNKIKYI